MSRGHPSDPIFRDYPQVSKNKLTVDDALAVQKAIGKVTNRATHIGRALGLREQRIEEIERLHRGDSRRAIAVIDSWLRQDFNQKQKPYSLHPEEYRCPSWWNLVWAVAHRAGGSNPREAEQIAIHFKSYQDENIATQQENFQNVSTEPFTEDMANDIRDDLGQAVWLRWYEIGVGLKLSTATLDALERAHTDDEQKMLGLLTTWIREDLSKDRPSWKRLLEVVAAPHAYGGQNRALALDLAKQNPSKKEGEASFPPAEHVEGSKVVYETITNIFSSGGETSSKEPQEAEAMEVEKAEPSSSTMDETGQALTTGVKEDSAIPQVATVHDPQPDIPVATIVDDAGQRPTPDQFIVYSRKSHKPGSSKRPHGLALIISNEKFDSSARLSNRVCSPYDDQRLTQTFTALGYRVVIRKNQSGAEMNRIFDDIKANKAGELHIKKDDDSFICVISSHGDWDPHKNTDLIYGRDRGTFYLQESVYEKLNAIVCPHLKGKPKLFFIQACRGAGYGRIADDGDTVVQLPPALPRESDFFISYSTAPETKSFRYDPNRPQPEGEPIDTTGDENYDGYIIGSFYITELCVALKRFAHRLDLMSMVLTVHQSLQASDKNLFKLGSKTTRQCPHMTASLRGPIFFYDEAENLFKEYMRKCFS